MVRDVYLNRIRSVIVLFMVCLILSGLTAMPLETEFVWMDGFIFSIIDKDSMIGNWYTKASGAIHYVNDVYPFLAYGTDWMAFGHLVIAVAFIGPLIDPVRNIWVIQFGIIACIMVFPMAFIAGEVRGIPVFWRIIDCAFGVGGLMLLVPCLSLIKKIENNKAYPYES